MATKVFKVLSVLLRQMTLTEEEIAKRVGVSPRQVRRYLDQLREEGFAIESCPGRGGGIRLAASAIDLPTLSVAEAHAVLLAGRAMLSESSFPEKEALQSGLIKIATTLRYEDAEAVQEQVSTIEFHLTSGGVQGTDYLTPLQEAIIDRQKVCMRYHSNKDEHIERVIHPYGVQQLEGVYYIDAFCEHRKAERRFRLDRIEELKTVGEWFKPDPMYRERLTACKPWGAISGEPEDFAFRIWPPAARWVAERLWHETQQLEWQSDGTLIFRVHASGRPEIRQWVLHWGAPIEVLEPESFREEVINEIRGMGRRYVDPDK